jgi:hypothetical protein
MSCGRYLPSLKAHKGWTAIDAIDLGEPTGECEACGKVEVRYIHLLTHPEHSSIKVGCVCAGKLTDDYVNPKAREKELRAKVSRKKRQQVKYPLWAAYKWIDGGSPDIEAWTYHGPLFIKVKRLRACWVIDYGGARPPAYIKARSLPEAAHRGLFVLFSSVRLENPVNPV